MNKKTYDIIAVYLLAIQVQCFFSSMEGRLGRERQQKVSKQSFAFSYLKF